MVGDAIKLSERMELSCMLRSIDTLHTRYIPIHVFLLK